jgi:2-polyprenyl-3-methyl-5-hydroxy-6-metoxy-1,4-benzoquinol methylase
VLSFVPHEAEWTPERVRRFWAYLSGSQQADRAYFSSHSGDGIVAFAERYVPLAGRRVLDYGCGPGYLIERLLQRGVRAEGLEFSPESIDQVRKRCGDHPLFGGITLAEQLPSPIASQNVDVVFLVEVLEHLPAEQLKLTLDDVRRVLRPGGFLVVTTPHNEDLDVLKTICPDCGCIFHHWQHVNSFTADGLVSLLGDYGMSPLLCKATTFGGRWPLKVLRVLRRAALKPWVSIQEPHLVYIGRRER